MLESWIGSLAQHREKVSVCHYLLTCYVQFCYFLHSKAFEKLTRVKLALLVNLETEKHAKDAKRDRDWTSLPFVNTIKEGNFYSFFFLFFHFISLFSYSNRDIRFISLFEFATCKMGDSICFNRRQQQNAPTKHHDDFEQQIIREMDGWTYKDNSGTNSKIYDKNDHHRVDDVHYSIGLMSHVILT